MRQPVLSDSRGAGARPADWRTRGETYRRFWSQLLERSRGRTPLFARKPPASEYHLHTSAGRSGFSLGYTLSVHGWASVDLFIDMGDKTLNKRAFDALAAEREAIEDAFGALLEWQRLNNKRASIIMYRIEDVHFDDERAWPPLQEQLIDAMIRLDAAMQPHIASLNI
ncbi:MAG: DUF4268 domain-containing protein [Anaerolineae bacterium]|nr:DUF4268 domain-containing protein [Anaerolineae bacterium]